MRCRAIREQLTAYADQAVAPDERERIAAHLVGCTPCREELAETIRVRRLLGETARPVTPQPDLAQRLVAIAGPEAHESLWLACDKGGGLPSLRRRRRNRVLLGLVGGSFATICAVGSMAMVAPGPRLVDDPDASLAVPPTSSLPSARTLVAQGSAVDACPVGFHCPSSLLGLPLLSRARIDQGPLVLVYGDGGTDETSRILVVEQRGVLRGQPDTKMPSVAWQSGEVVYCVLSRSEWTTGMAAQQLPHEQPAGTSTLSRVAAGWHQLTGSRR